MPNKHTIIFIVGPTSSGKSAVAAELARRVNGEVISCDSMQVYKDMDIISQAPGREIEKIVGARHAVPLLIRVVSPEEEFSAARFVEMAVPSIGSAVKAGRVPIVAGGTGLYVKALVDGIFPDPAKDEGLRDELAAIAEEKGREYLYNMLADVDPAAAAGMHPNNVKKVIRALEVYKLTGKTISEKKNGSRGISSEYECMMFGLGLPRNVLYVRINDKVEKMFAGGLVEEITGLKKRPISITAEQALGIKEVSAFLSGDMTLEQAKEELKKNTRHYAKRQLTWFRGDRRVVWIDADREVGAIVEEISVRLEQGA